MSDKELSVLEKARREIHLVEWSITTVTITAQAYQRMYHTEQFSENYNVALDALRSQLSIAKARCTNCER